MKKTEADETRIEGYPISPGIAVGQVFQETLTITPSYTTIDASQVEAEKKRFREALQEVRNNVKQHISDIHNQMNEELNQIIRAHEMMLYDEDILQKIEARIENEHKDAAWALDEEKQELIAQFEATRDPYLQARAEDVQDLATNILRILTGSTSPQRSSPNATETHIMVTKNLYPSLAFQAYKRKDKAFVTESPAISSHAAIILKGMGIPVVGAVNGLLSAVEEGDEILVDGINGKVIVHPDPATKEEYEEFRRSLQQQATGDEYAPEETFTEDGTKITLLANIEHPHHASLVFHNKLEGIGLFRTEFLAIEQNSIPGEAEQYKTYRALIDEMNGHPVIIRSLDLGADKQIGNLNGCAGLNPALGVRGIRRHIGRESGELNTQLRAILRAATGGSVSIMFPMITTVEDIKISKQYIASAKEELHREGLQFAKDIRVGAMIEVPSAAIDTAAILSEVDFVSVGTNDLLQYFTAADRNNPEVIPYYNPKTPAFIWLLQYIMSEASNLGRQADVNLCGELASDPDFILHLLQAGYRVLSISPVSTAKIRNKISSIRL
ncbi:MAG: phosphoenolpyruvate--protein phosphotransferase [Spirochaetia bacterium]|nr:phosphoenolpyruvate--protein phosphotransferase [Spirochaetia bacterium]